MQNNISLLVGLKNNLDYNKHFYETTRKLYPEVELCFVSYGSKDGTHEWLDSLADKNLNYYYSTEDKTFSDTFNKAAELATKDFVAYLHNDIVLAPGFLENIEKHVGARRVVSYTTIEPPIFAGHARPGKIIYDLGVDLKGFDLNNLYEFAAARQLADNNKVEPGITFFMCMPRETLIEIGGMDNLFNPMFCEDDDLIRRFELLGFECFTSLDAICYHFVSKTSRFSEEYQNRTMQIEVISRRNFARKWGSYVKGPKYNIAIVVTNATLPIVDALEPLCDRLYIDDAMGIIQSHYLDKEQPNTKYDLSKRVLNAQHNDPQGENDIVVTLDGRQLTNNSLNLIINLPLIIQESGEIGDFELGNLKITINSLTEYQNDLIYLK